MYSVGHILISLYTGVRTCVCVKLNSNYYYMDIYIYIYRFIMEKAI